jgi:hypothetical protein
MRQAATEAGTDGSGGGDQRWLEWLGARIEGRDWQVVVAVEAGLAVTGLAVAGRPWLA